MKFEASTPRGNVVIQGLGFSVARPFGKGHSCTSSEADALNQLLAENVRNNFAKKVKEAGEKPDVPTLQKALDSYVIGYEFGVRRGGSADPVDREARRIATEAVKRAIKSKGHKLADFSSEKIRALAEKVVADNPKVMAQAKAAVAARESIGVEELEDV